MSACDCEWLGDCSCEIQVLPVMTPAKACRIRLKNQDSRGALAKEHATASESTPN